MRCFWSASLVWGLSRYLLESKSGTGHEANQKGRKTLPLCRSVCQHGERGSTQLTSVEPCSWQSLNRPCKPTATSTFHRGENGAGSSGPFVPRTVRGQVLNLAACLRACMVTLCAALGGWLMSTVHQKPELWTGRWKQKPADMWRVFCEPERASVVCSRVTEEPPGTPRSSGKGLTYEALLHATSWFTTRGF